MARMFNGNNQNTNLTSFVKKKVCMYDKITAFSSSFYVHGYKMSIN